MTYRLSGLILRRLISEEKFPIAFCVCFEKGI